MTVGILKRLGYGGSAVIDGVQVLITSGSFDETLTTSCLQMVDTPPASSGATKVFHADGVNSYTGSLAFDVTKAAMAMFTTSRMLKRWYPFNVGINDGNVGQVLSGCKLTSLTLSGAPGGLVTASVSFMATTPFAAGSVTNAFIRDDTSTSGELIGYWWSGRSIIDMNLKSWTLTMTQDAQIVYGNEATTEPLYIRVGLVNYTLEIETYDEFLLTNNVISICTSSFTLVGKPDARGFSFNGVTDLGTFRYTFSTASTSGVSDAVVIS